MNSVASNLVNSITGNVSKGYLMIKKGDTVVPEPGPSREGASASKNKFMQAMDKVSDAGTKAVSKANAALQKSSLLQLDSNVLDAAGDDYNIIQVQYNPQTITMNTIRGNILNKSAGGFGENQYQQLNVPARTTLSVDLIFDQTNIFDAFNFENVITIAGMKDFAKQASTSQMGDEYTVRPIVEAFIGAMASNETRYVIFVWNKMAFNGELTGVQAEYTMFNRKSEPIRARVGLQIFQENRENKVVERTSAYWKKAYNDLFNKKFRKHYIK